ncbi:MAG: helix-hairpin-helix domain-containing protein [Longimonas sp.]|uniref:ComEA family DNA-binding protein n=1 Tax=Longimonas sp. TaxID=2039626 RepID=UPI003975F46C
MRWLYRWQRHVALTALETTVLLGLVSLLLLGLGVEHWQMRQIPPLADSFPPEAVERDTAADTSGAVSANPEDAASGDAAPSLAAPPPPPVNVNTADADMLQTLSGIGPALSERIITHRTTHGPFQSVEGLQSVSGIGPKTVESIAERVVLSDDE